MSNYKDLEKRRATIRKYSKKYWREHPAYREKSRAYHQAWRKANPGKIRAYNLTQRRAHWEKWKENVYAWRKANPEKQRAIDARYYAHSRETIYAANARRRAQKRCSAIGHVDYVAVRIRDKMRCGICGRKVSRKEMVFDHIVPLACGGAHAEWNIQVAHRNCNERKGPGRLPSQVRLPI